MNDQPNRSPAKVALSRVSLLGVGLAAVMITGLAITGGVVGALGGSDDQRLDQSAAQSSEPSGDATNDAADQSDETVASENEVQPETEGASESAIAEDPPAANAAAGEPEASSDGESAGGEAGDFESRPAIDWADVVIDRSAETPEVVAEMARRARANGWPEGTVGIDFDEVGNCKVFRTLDDAELVEFPGGITDISTESDEQLRRDIENGMYDAFDPNEVVDGFSDVEDMPGTPGTVRISVSELDDTDSATQRIARWGEDGTVTVEEGPVDWDALEAEFDFVSPRNFQAEWDAIPFCD